MLQGSVPTTGPCLSLPCNSRAKKNCDFAEAASPVAASGYGAVGAVAIAPSSYFLQPRPQILQPPVRVPVVQPQMQLQHLQSVPQLQTFPTGAPSPQMMMAAPGEI